MNLGLNGMSIKGKEEKSYFGGKLDELPQRKLVYYRNPNSGLIEAYDSDSGDLVLIQNKLTDMWDTIAEQAVEVKLPDGRMVWIQKGLSVDNFKSQEEYAYSTVTADLICQRVAEGDSLNKICRTEGFPSYSTICRWRRQHPEFKEAIEQAYSDRGETLRDQIDSLADEVDVDNKDVVKLKAELKKWLASKDSAKYDSKPQVQAGGGGVTFIIETGIRVSGDENFNRDVTVDAYKDKIEGTKKDDLPTKID